MLKETSEKVNEIIKSFDMKDYNSYLNGDMTRGALELKYQCTNHVLTLVFKELNLISRQDYIRNRFHEDIFNEINSEQSAYLLGFYVADGTITNNKLCFQLSKSDLEHLNLIKSLISPNSKTRITKENVNKQGIKTNGMCSFDIRSEHICSVLEDYGLGKHKTYLSKSIKNIVPDEYMWHFIRGYFDGDGCVSSSNVKKIVKGKEYKYINVGWTIISHDKTLLEEIQEFIQKDLNVEITLYPDKKGNFLVGTHSKKVFPLIYDNLYKNATIFMLRKYEKFKDIIANTEVSSEIAKGSETP